MVENSFDKDTSKSIDFDSLTYKDTKILTNYLSEQGKILPRRISGLSSKQQKKVAKLIKTARFKINKVTEKDKERDFDIIL